MADFGRDLSCLADIDPSMREVEGVELVRQSAYRRLDTRRGQQIDDETYGDAIVDSLGGELSQTELTSLPARIQAELAKDEDIAAITTETTTGQDGSVEITILGETADGPFKFVLPVGRVTSDLLGS